MRTIPTLSSALALLFLLVSSAWATESSKCSNEVSLCEYSDPVFWIVNSRCAPRCQGLEAGFDRLKYQRWCPDTRCFVDENLESFLAAQAQLPTLVYVHGNSLDHKHALESGWGVYERIRVCPGPKMLVLYSWPAEIVHKRPLITPIKLARKNIRTKYVYAEHQGYYVARLVQLMSTANPLTLGGHSYGAACSLVASHYLGGGQLNGYCLDGGSPDLRCNFRLSLISPALDNDHLYPGHRYDRAIFPVERIHTTYSTKDATLKRWPTHSFRGQQAMGYTGICANRLGENAHKICQQQLDADVGRSHYMKQHLASMQMISALCQTAFNTLPTPGVSNGKRSPRSAPSMELRDVIQVPAQLAFPGLAL